MCGRPVLAFEVTGQVGRLPLPQSSGDLRLARLVWEFSAIADRVWQMKAALANPLVEIFENRESHGQSNRGSWHS
jgi:hypothetical protein